MELALNPNRIVNVAIVIALALVGAHVSTLVLYYSINDPNQFDFVRLLDLDYEGNIPTLYSALIFIFNGCLLALIAQFYRQQNDRQSIYWLFMAFIFVFLGIDEGSRLHEEVGDWVENFVNARGFLYFPWVIPYSVVLLIVGLFYLRFYLRLDSSLKIRLAFSAILFLSGALGFELLSAVEADSVGTTSLRYSVLYTIEESLELSGLILFMHTLLWVLRLNITEIKVMITQPNK